MAVNASKKAAGGWRPTPEFQRDARIALPPTSSTIAGAADRDGGQMPDRKPYQVVACNLAKNSENKMHDDTVARRFGFVGGLVPGVDVFAYMSHMPVARWGRAFLERGVMEGRFVKPVYDGESVDVFAEEVDGGLTLTVESRGEVCATGRAALPSEAPKLRLEDFQSVAVVAKRLPVDERSYAPGCWLGIPPFRQGLEAMKVYLQGIGETEPLYGREAIVHPGMLLRMMNWALMENAILGPWIHVGNTLQHLGVAFATDELTVRAKVTDNYERKGHRFVELDGVIVANDRTLVAHCLYTAIYQPREVAAA
jgi:acyl dehydratase